MSLQDKVTLVTGSGLGEGIAKRFAAGGTKVAEAAAFGASLQASMITGVAMDVGGGRLI